MSNWEFFNYLRAIIINFKQRKIAVAQTESLIEF